MSEPNRSRPSQWSSDGPGTLVGVTSPAHSAEPGSYGVSSGAKIATSTKNASTISAPTMAVGLRRSRRKAPARARRRQLLGRRIVAASSTGIGEAHDDPHPRVDDAVGDVHRQVDQRVDDRDEQDEALQDGVVTLADRLEQVLPDPVEREDGLGEDRTREQQPGLQPDRRRRPAAARCAARAAGEIVAGAGPWTRRCGRSPRRSPRRPTPG